MHWVLGGNRIGYVLGRIAQAISLRFDAAKISFTAGMSKRTPPAGPFAAAPIIQGKLSEAAEADLVTIPAGSQISGSFYGNLDANQGSIVFWITPEWNGDDGENHIFFDDSGTILINKTSVNNLHIFSRATGEVLSSVSIAAWVAGTTYCVVARWDTKNPIDGTNYACISVNDVHTFGKTASFAPGTPSGIYVGCRYALYGGTDRYPANAIIQGLTVYRRVLFDGSYGVDVGNGDELALIYNSGSGTDPTEITGSWDVCMCLCTDSQTGALA